MSNTHTPNAIQKPNVAIIDHQNMVIMAKNHFKNIDYRIFKQILERKYKVHEIIMCDARVPLAQEKTNFWVQCGFDVYLNHCDYTNSQPTNADASIIKQVKLWRHEANTIVLWTEDQKLQKIAQQMCESETNSAFLKVVSPYSYLHKKSGQKHTGGQPLYTPMSKEDIARQYTRKYHKARHHKKPQIVQIGVGNRNIIQIIQNQNGTNLGIKKK